jgi:DNA-binding NarL/FixJ family response regulator
MHDNPLFSIAADFVNNTSRHIFLTGKAGTGKTTFLKYIRETTKKKCVVVAPTGVAAINAGGMTMHSFFQLPLGPFVPRTHRSTDNGGTDQYTLFKELRVSDQKREMFRDLELLIIDEVSMVRCDMLDATDAILRYFRKSPHTPFGGVQVLYIGDLFQLPPVVPESDWSLLRQFYQSPFFFHSKVVEEAPPVYLELKKIYRQSQQEFIDILNRIRNNQATQADLDVLNARGDDIPNSGHKYVTLTTHNYKADRINNAELNRLPGAMFEFKGEVQGDFPERNLPTDQSLKLKVGAQVMFIRNDKSEDRRYYNGKIATVKEIDDDGIRVILSDSEEELLLEKETWSNIRYSYNAQQGSIDEELLGSFTQYPIRLAWAITIHKSQGLTFQHAIIDAGDSFAPGQVYVALSRCTSLDGLICRSRILPSSISTDPLVLEFSRNESSEGELSILLEKERVEYLRQQLTGAFDCGKLVDIATRFWHDTKFPSTEAEQLFGQCVRHIEQLQIVSIRFQQQLRSLLASDDDVQLRERVRKAIEYFCGVLEQQVIKSLDDHIQSLSKAKRVRKYLKRVKEFRNMVARQANVVKRVRYGDFVFCPELSPVEPVKTSTARKERGRRPKKGESLLQTLSMLKSGISISEIAQQRGLSVGTIHTHFAELIRSGEVNIYDHIEEDRIKTISNVVRDMPTQSVSSVKDTLGIDFSYGEIRAVLAHLQVTEPELFTSPDPTTTPID